MGANGDMDEALDECRFYNKMGGLDDQTFKDIALENDVDTDELKQNFYKE